jgi:hypothetical protein
VKMISNVSYLFPFFGCRSKFSTIAVAVTTEDSYWCCTGVALPPWGMSCWLYCSPWLTSQQHSFDPWLWALGIKLFSHSACLATLDWLLQKNCMVVLGNSTKKKNPLPPVHSKNNETLIVVRSDLWCLIVPWHLPINPPSALWTHDSFEHVNHHHLSVFSVPGWGFWACTLAARWGLWCGHSSNWHLWVSYFSLCCW